MHIKSHPRDLWAPGSATLRHCTTSCRPSPPTASRTSESPKCRCVFLTLVVSLTHCVCLTRCLSLPHSFPSHSFCPPPLFLPLLRFSLSHKVTFSLLLALTRCLCIFLTRCLPFTRRFLRERKQTLDPNMDRARIERNQTLDHNVDRSRIGLWAGSRLRRGAMVKDAQERARRDAVGGGRKGQIP